MSWIGLYLPWLSLEAFVATLPPEARGTPIALMHLHQVVSLNRAAHALGVQRGMKRATALALAPQLLFGEAHEGRDAAALQSVAHAALAFSPMVCLSPPAGVLLDVSTTLRYFGGIDRLSQRLDDTLAPLGHRVFRARAPTAQGAALLSRWRDGVQCPDLATLQAALDDAPLSVLAAAQPHLETFQGMGLRHLGELRRLPRAGLARRFGEALLDELDSASGDRPDPREAVVLPPAFDSEVELFARADTTDQLLHGAEVLLARLVVWLSARHAFVRRFQLVLRHEGRLRQADGPAVTRVDVALAEPSRDAGHLQSLLRERLSAFVLPAPTLELALHAHDIAKQPPPNTELFPTPSNEREGLVRLIERLQARLGPARVQRLVRVPDHRPDRCAHTMPYEPGAAPRAPEPVVTSRRPVRRQARGAAERAAASPVPKKPPVLLAHPLEPERPAPSMRPVWLMPEPVPLAERQSRPLLDGQVLQLLCGPERIEAGWWDEGLAERDYFIAQTPDGALVWVYRARLPLSDGEGWFLQGRFG